MARTAAQKGLSREIEAYPSPTLRSKKQFCCLNEKKPGSRSEPGSAILYTDKQGALPADATPSK
jgi:hypothetical protein